MLREMLASSSCEKLAAHTHTDLPIPTCMQTHTFIHRPIHTHPCTLTQNWANSVERLRTGAFTGDLSADNTRRTGPAAAVNLSPLQLPVFLE